VRLEIGEPDLHERPDRLLDPGLTGECQRRLPALARLRRVDPLFETVVTGYEMLLDPGTKIVVRH
jgi:hypothetical protein